MDKIRERERGHTDRKIERERRGGDRELQIGIDKGMESKERKRKMYRKCKEKWRKIRREIIDIEIKVERDGKKTFMKIIKKRPINCES